MQLLQPKVKELQKKYGHDRERLAQETMKLYKDSGTNPFASCLPILLQMPIFFALFRLIDEAADGGATASSARRRPRTSGRRRSSACCRSRHRSPTPVDALGPDRRRLPGAGDDRHDVLDPAAADAQEHADRRADRSLRPAAEDAALRAPGRVRGRRHRVPDRCPPLLDHLEPVDDGSAVLRDPQQPRARDGGRLKQERDRKKAAEKGLGGADGSTDAAAATGTTATATEPERKSDRRPPQRQQPKRQSKSQRQSKTPRGGTTPAGNQRAQNEKRNGKKQ